MPESIHWNECDSQTCVLWTFPDLCPFDRMKLHYIQSDIDPSRSVLPFLIGSRSPGCQTVALSTWESLNRRSRGLILGHSMQKAWSLHTTELPFHFLLLPSPGFYREVALLLTLRLLLFTLVFPSVGKSSRKTGESNSSLPTSVNCRGLWLATCGGGKGLLGSMKVSTWPNNPPVLWGREREREIVTMVFLKSSFCSRWER